jgi:GH25 family lysozyme M1 (1,4-beta-N-acetylmuramidase)
VRPENTPRPHHAAPRGRIGPAIVCAMLLFATMALSGPRDTFGASTMAAACDGVNLRTGPSTSTASATSISAGTQVGVLGTVTGDQWSAACPGPVSGNTWYQISEVSGTSVASLFGVESLYGATGLFVTATPTPTPSITPTPPPGPTFIEGIDVSHWQGTIDWPAVAAAGKLFAYIKASEGISFVDADFAANHAQAKAAGLYVGAYHYARPDATAGDAVAEADHFIDTAQPAAGELLPVLDLEDDGGLSTAALQDWVQAYLGRIHERLGVRGVIYVSPNFWKTDMGDTTWFATAGYPVLWIAHWTDAGAPSVPAANWAGNGWTFWQYTSNGTVPGISGRVDLDRYAGTDFNPVLIGGNPDPSAPPDPSLGLTSSASRTVYREYVMLTTVLQPLGANRPVAIQRRSPADATWVTIANLTTDASGTATYSYGPPHSTEFRAVFPGAADLGAATSLSVAVNVYHTASIQPYNSSVKSITRGTRITYTAIVRPRAPSGTQTASFLIYQRVGGAWVYRTSATKALVDGATTFSWTWSRSGEWYIRVRSNATPYNLASLSPIVRVRVR